MDLNKVNDVMYSYTADTAQMEDENRVLKETLKKLKEDLDRIRQPSLMVCEVHDLIGKEAIIKVPNGNMFFVNVMDTVKARPGDMVLCEQKNLTIIKKIDIPRKFNVEQFVIVDKPDISWDDVGGLSHKIREIQEVIELPLKKPELFKKIGITPPKGILLYGPPGTGKTLLAKAVASSTKSTFIEVVGSELVQKFIGEGAKLVKDVFELARTKAPSIIFIDEIDAIASKRVDIGTSGEREVQRTFMQLLAEIDGFNPLGDVKVIGATNRKDILDPAVIRPGRLDRLIKIELPDNSGIEQIFNIHSRRMKKANLNMSKLLFQMEGFSGAEIRAVCTEAGYFAIRENRFKITQKDFEQAILKVKQEELEDGGDYMNMFG